MKAVSPYHSDKPKKAQVEEMFDNISGEYDRLNDILSLGIHKRWRKRLVAILAKEKPERILDLATGTAALALECARQTEAQITGVDLSEKMLAIGRDKIQRSKFKERIRLEKGDAEMLPFGDNTFDAVTIAFGVRNFGDLKKGLKEMRRVLQESRSVYILEFSRIQHPLLRGLFKIYFNHITPVIGRFLSKDPRAYTYLPESVSVFPYGEEMKGILRECGYQTIEAIPFTSGTATLYIGRK